MHQSASHLMGFLIALLTLFLALSESPVSRATDSTTLVYKGCANQTFQDPTGQYSQALSALFGSLVSASTKSKFFKTTTGSNQASLTGLFQCRGDLTENQCYDCVSNLPVLTGKICGGAVAARIQLYGCYLLYAVAGFNEDSGMQMLFKACSTSTRSGSGFEEKRDTAFSGLASGMVGGHGFYTVNYQSVYALGQCEGDVGDSDCGACVRAALQRAQVECGNSISGQIYLSKCYVSYTYYPNGAPKKPSYSAPSSSYESSSPGNGQNTGKTVAIILGAAAGVGFLVICLMFARGLMKHQDDS